MAMHLVHWELILVLLLSDFLSYAILGVARDFTDG
jgi:hypothetical protein